MSMTLLVTNTSPYTPFTDIGGYDLICDGHISVFSMSWAVVPHPVKIVSLGPDEMVWSLPYLKAESGLFVETGILMMPPTGVLLTRVFNLTSKPIRIKPGTVVARLLCTKMVL